MNKSQVIWVGRESETSRCRAVFEQTVGHQTTIETFYLRQPLKNWMPKSEEERNLNVQRGILIKMKDKKND